MTESFEATDDSGEEGDALAAALGADLKALRAEVVALRRKASTESPGGGPPPPPRRQPSPEPETQHPEPDTPQVPPPPPPLSPGPGASMPEAPMPGAPMPGAPMSAKEKTRRRWGLSAMGRGLHRAWRGIKSADNEDGSGGGSEGEGGGGGGGGGLGDGVGAGGCREGATLEDAEAKAERLWVSVGSGLASLDSGGGSDEGEGAARGVRWAEEPFIDGGAEEEEEEEEAIGRLVRHCGLPPSLRPRLWEAWARKAAASSANSSTASSGHPRPGEEEGERGVAGLDAGRYWSLATRALSGAEFGEWGDTLGKDVARTRTEVDSESGTRGSHL